MEFLKTKGRCFDGIRGLLKINFQIKRDLEQISDGINKDEYKNIESKSPNHQSDEKFPKDGLKQQFIRQYGLGCCYQNRMRTETDECV
ncbi:hypothetical protein F8M41_025380 [Gigaspora margarita]|uniref:Uncharacterized protein n=1 Tax=Gigaspora margarita TaxID=4874 RepID=A0A8H3XKA9_GIGMA|nr:hypothetical protein F8M41_025380 [Gigaspora margarita]